MNTALFISYQALVEDSTIDENFNPKTIRLLINELQQMEIAPILGASLYSKLMSDILAGTLSEAQKILLNIHIKPVLINAIQKDLPFVNGYKFHNVGTIERTAENSKNIDQKELQKVSDFFKTKMVFWAGKLSEFLRDNSIDYPEYQGGINRPKSAQYETKIYLG